MSTVTTRSTSESIIAGAREALATAGFGLSDVAGPDPQRSHAGVYNAVVFGRSVTFRLQNLRGTVGKERFDTWYAPRQEEMRQDPLLRWFHELRTQIEKQGSPDFAVKVDMQYLNTGDVSDLMRQGPPGTVGVFFGDNMGGSGWDVVLPDGSREKCYFALPPHMARTMSVELILSTAPDEHLGVVLKDKSIAALIRLYLDHMERLINEAEREFIGPSSP